MKPGAVQAVVEGKSSNSRKERLQLGRSHRKQLSRAKMGALEPRPHGFDPVTVLQRAREGRVPSLLPIKYSRMAASPFAFFRGAVAIMAADLARGPNTGLIVQLCGDAHIQNMGSFEAPDGRLVFDINDFDETIPGPWEWDVKRMATSIVLAGLEAGNRRSACASAAQLFARTYCKWIETFGEQPVLTAARHQIHRVEKAQAVSAALRQAERACPADLLKKYTENGSRGSIHFKKIEHAIWRVQGKNRQDVLASLQLYKQSLPPERLHLFDFFRPLDVGFKIVGTGSVALRDYVLLMEGNGAQDALFLQIKQEAASAYAPYLNGLVYAHQGQRVVEGQRRIQPLSDLFLGWTRIGEHDFLVRQLNDHKGSINLAQLRGEGLNSLASVAGELLARGHARSGDALTIKGYIGAPAKMVKSLSSYALEYAAQTEHDFEQFQKAIREGRLKTVS